METFFYAVIALCGLLLAVQMLILAMRLRRDGRPRNPPTFSGGANLGGLREDDREPALSALTNATLSTAPDRTETREADQGEQEKRAARKFLDNLRSPMGFSNHGLTIKMITGFAAIIAAFGLIASVTVYFALSASLRRQASERANMMVLHVRDNLPAYRSTKDISRVRAFLQQYARRNDLAYVLIEDRKGRILAHSSTELSKAFRREPVNVSDPTEKWRPVMVGHRAVYEVSAPGLRGRVGAVRLGIWRGAMESENFLTIWPWIRMILLLTVAGILAAIFIVWKILRPIHKLARAAKSISSGDLSAPSLDVADPTECGELSRAIERLRASVKAAMVRLSG